MTKEVSQQDEVTSKGGAVRSWRGSLSSRVDGRGSDRGAVNVASGCIDVLTLDSRHKVQRRQGSVEKQTSDLKSTTLGTVVTLGSRSIVSHESALTARKTVALINAAAPALVHALKVGLREVPLVHFAFEGLA